MRLKEERERNNNKMYRFICQILAFKYKHFICCGKEKEFDYGNLSYIYASIKHFSFYGNIGSYPHLGFGGYYSSMPGIGEGF
jgi:hypothetical protein